MKNIKTEEKSFCLLFLFLLFSSQIWKTRNRRHRGRFEWFRRLSFCHNPTIAFLLSFSTISSTVLTYEVCFEESRKFQFVKDFANKNKRKTFAIEKSRCLQIIFCVFYINCSFIQGSWRLKGSKRSTYQSLFSGQKLKGTSTTAAPELTVWYFKLQSFKDLPLIKFVKVINFICFQPFFRFLLHISHAWGKTYHTTSTSRKK